MSPTRMKFFIIFLSVFHQFYTFCRVCTIWSLLILVNFVIKTDATSRVIPVKFCLAYLVFCLVYLMFCLAYPMFWLPYLVFGGLFGEHHIFFGIIGVCDIFSPNLSFCFPKNFPNSNQFCVLCGKKVRRLEKGTPPWLWRL